MTTINADKTYNYGRAFQLGVLALLAQDPGFRNNFEDVIDPNYFDTDDLRAVSRMMLGIHRGNKVMTLDAMDAELTDYCLKYGVKDDFKEKLIGIVNSVFSMSIDHLDYIPERVVHFARRQVVADAVLKMVQVVQNDEDLEACRNLIEGALQVGAARELGLDLQNSVDDLPRLLELSSMDESRKIPTGLPSLDTIMRGGLGVGQLGMILGPTGRGKSIVLTNLAVNAILFQKKVTYITFELSEIEVLVRVLMRLTSCTDEEVTKQSPHFKTAIANIGQKATRYLKIKYFAPGTITTGQLRAYIARLRCAESWTPDLIILDDGDSFRTPTVRGSDSSATYHAQGETYTQIIALLNDFKAACWAATQAQRAAYDLDVVTVGHTAESFKKVHRAQAALALCQTKEEAAVEQARIYIAKGRGFRDGIFIPVQFRKNIMLMQERPDMSTIDLTGHERRTNYTVPLTEIDLSQMVGQAETAPVPE